MAPNTINISFNSKFGQEILANILLNNKYVSGYSHDFQTSDISLF